MIPSRSSFLFTRYILDISGQKCTLDIQANRKVRPFINAFLLGHFRALVLRLRHRFGQFEFVGVNEEKRESIYT